MANVRKIFILGAAVLITLALMWGPPRPELAEKANWSFHSIRVLHSSADSSVSSHDIYPEESSDWGTLRYLTVRTRQQVITYEIQTEAYPVEWWAELDPGRTSLTIALLLAIWLCTFLACRKKPAVAPAPL
jgi:hypothetical protein